MKRTRPHEYNQNSHRIRVPPMDVEPTERLLFGMPSSRLIATRPWVIDAFENYIHNIKTTDLSPQRLQVLRKEHLVHLSSLGTIAGMTMMFLPMHGLILGNNESAIFVPIQFYKEYRDELVSEVSAFLPNNLADCVADFVGGACGFIGDTYDLYEEGATDLDCISTLTDLVEYEEAVKRFY